MGHIMVPVPPGCPLQGLAHTVGRTLGVPSDRVCLTSDHGGPYLETDEDVGRLAQHLGHPARTFQRFAHTDTMSGCSTEQHTARASTRNSPLPAENIPFFLCHTLALAHDFACTWTPFEAEDGSVYWCFPPF